MNQRVVQETVDEMTPVPLVVAVTGQRDLVAAEIPELRRLTREFLQVTRANCGDTPVVVLTPLAEGAGQLVEQEALDRRLQLIVPLPMPKDVYRGGFANCTGAAIYVPARRDP